MKTEIFKRARRGATSAHRHIFKRNLLSSAVSLAIGATLLVPGLAMADPSVADLQAENERLKQELELLKQGLKSQQSGAGAKAAVNEAEAEPTEAATDKTKAAAAAKAQEEERITQNVLDSVVISARARGNCAGRAIASGSDRRQATGSRQYCYYQRASQSSA